MTFKQFVDSLKTKSPPQDIILKALWLDKNGSWSEAHDLVDNMSGQDADRVHSYLHRKEGDEWNAKYWYSKIRIPMPDMTSDEEWEMLARKYTT